MTVTSFILLIIIVSTVLSLSAIALGRFFGMLGIPRRSYGLAFSILLGATVYFTLRPAPASIPLAASAPSVLYLPVIGD